MIGAAIWGVQALLSMISLVVRRPWTTALARRRTPAEHWDTDLFHETNMVVTAAWTSYFLVAAACSAAGPVWIPVAFALLSMPLTPLSFRLAQRYADARMPDQADQVVQDAPSEADGPALRRRAG